jgi:hypothetical protein
MADAYVYYTLPDGFLPTAMVTALFKAMQPYTAAAPRLYRRCDGQPTWMEVYSGIEDVAAFKTALQKALNDWPSGLVRHTEWFEPVADETAP